MDYSSFYDSPFVMIIVGFLGLVFLAGPVDLLTQSINRFVQRILDRFSWLPDNVADEAAFFIVAAIAFVVCWRGQFDFYSYLNFKFTQYEGYLATAITVSLGSGWLKERFDLMNLIPLNISGVTSSVLRSIKGSGKSD